MNRNKYKVLIYLIVIALFSGLFLHIKRVEAATMNCYIGTPTINGRSITVFLSVTESGGDNTDYYNAHMLVNPGEGGGQDFYGGGGNSVFYSFPWTYSADGTYYLTIHGSANNINGGFNSCDATSPPIVINTAPPPPPPKGTIYVTSNISTSWTVAGYSCNGCTTNGGGYAVDPGTYTLTVTVPPPYCYPDPVINANPQTVADGGYITFTITYTYYSGCGSPPPPPPPPPGGGSCGGWDPNDCAQFITQTGIPTNVYTGQTFNATVTMKNTGTATWQETNAGDSSRQHYRLASAMCDGSGACTGSGSAAIFCQSPCSEDSFGSQFNRTYIPAGTTVPQGSQYTFNLAAITAPASQATYYFGRRMVHDGTDFFGDYSPKTAINVWLRPVPDIKCKGPSDPSFTNGPCTIVQGQTAQLSWSVSGGPASSCTMDSASAPTSNPGYDVSPVSSYAYNFVCQGNAGTEAFNDSVSIVVVQPSGIIYVNSDTPTSWTVAGQSSGPYCAGSNPPSCAAVPPNQTTATYSQATTGNPVSPGSWTITGSALAGYTGPFYTNAQTQTLSNGSSITFNMSYIGNPTNLTADGTANCGSITLDWNDNATNETFYRVYRALSSGGPFSQQGPDLAPDTTEYIDSTVTGNTTYYYYVKAFVASNGSSQSNTAHSFSPVCNADISNSQKRIYQVNGVNYTSNMIINDGDTVTYRITISNSNTALASAVINGITDTVPTGNLNNIQNIKVDKGSGFGPILSSFNDVTGTIAPGENWVVQFDTTASTSGGNSTLFTNSAVINCNSSVGGQSCSSTKTVSHLNGGTGGTNPPQFREVAP